MRDDFLFFCHRHESMRPVLPDLTMLGPPEGLALRRALVQPATKCGYRFEEDELVDEILADVEGERGALPLLAFAASRLWELRDRETGLLTRQAYRDIGGVGGALARHAEATIDRIGTDRIAIVRELFRNLVTAVGTRAVREWDDLCCPCFQRTSRVDRLPTILRKLIDARLLTSYEIREDENEPTRHVEIIHESLLANWPRLVRWQTQDQEGAQLRDELRQSARAWDEHGRHDDRLWTGTAFREYQLWRDRYPGGLSEIEEAFARSMSAHAKRRLRRRRVAVAAVLAIALVVTAVTTVLWRRSVFEGQRAEAQKLIALGQLQLEDYPTAAVAHAIGSLELADSRDARRLALDALWEGPTARWRPGPKPGKESSALTADGLSRRRELPGIPTNPGCQSSRVTVLGRRWNIYTLRRATFSFPPLHPQVISFPSRVAFRCGSSFCGPRGSESRVAEYRYEQPVIRARFAEDAERGRHVALVLDGEWAVFDSLGFDGSTERLGKLPYRFPAASALHRTVSLDPRTARTVAAVRESEVLLFDLGDHSISEPRPIGSIVGEIADVEPRPAGPFCRRANTASEVRLLDITGLHRQSHSRRLRESGFSDSLAMVRCWRQAKTRKGGGCHTSWAVSKRGAIFFRKFDLGKFGWGFWQWDTTNQRVARWGPDLQDPHLVDGRSDRCRTVGATEGQYRAADSNCLRQRRGLDCRLCRGGPGPMAAESGIPGGHRQTRRECNGFVIFFRRLMDCFLF